MNRFSATLALLAMIVTAVLLAIFSSTPPMTEKNTAPLTRFSAERAMATVAMVGQKSHPVGSPEAAEVRNAITARLQALGLSVTKLRRIGVGLSGGSMPTAQAGETETLVAVLPGSDRTLPAVAIMAHTDSVPDSLGAADDGVGVAVAIETARAIAAGPNPVRDVMLILTDGEEAGLLGAQAFFADKERASHIGALVNVDSRGTSGLGTMFETGPGSGGLVDLYRTKSTHRFAHSAATFLYHQLPNRTDLTMAMDSGIPALNFAFLDGEFDYHTPRDRIASVDPRTIQSLGDQVFPVVQALAVNPVLPVRGEDGVFGDAPGIVALRYPAWVGWPLLVFGILVAAWASRGASPVASARSFAATLWIAFATALAVSLGYGLTGVGTDWAEHHRIMAEFQRYQIALALAAGGIVLAGGAALRSGSRRSLIIASCVTAGVLAALLGRPLMPTAVITAIAAVLGALAFGSPVSARDLRTGSLAVGIVASVALQLLAPPLTPLFLWPTLAAILAAAWARALPYPAIATALFGILPLAYILSFGHAVLLALGIPTPEAIGLFAMIAAVLLLPLVERPVLWAGGTAAFIAVVLLLSFRFSAPTERHPALSRIYGVVDEHGRSWRVSPLERPDPWTIEQLRAGGVEPTRADMPIVAAGPVWRAPTSAIAGALPAVALERAGDATVITVTPADGAREVMLDLVIDKPLSRVEIAGVRLAKFAVGPGKWKVRWQSSGLPLRLKFNASPGTHLDLTAAAISLDRMALPARPETVVPWLGSDRVIRVANADVTL